MNKIFLYLQIFIHLFHDKWIFVNWHLSIENRVCESFKKTMILGFVLSLLPYAMFNLWSMFHDCAASLVVYPYIQHVFYCLSKDNDAWTRNILLYMLKLWGVLSLPCTFCSDMGMRMAYTDIILQECWRSNE